MGWTIGPRGFQHLTLLESSVSNPQSAVPSLQFLSLQSPVPQTSVRLTALRALAARASSRSV